jgi:glutaredoxin
MKVLILATKDCHHRPQVEEQLRKRDISYHIKYVDEHPDLVQKFKTYSSPNIIINGEVVFRANHEQSLPTKEELKAIFSA